MSAITAERGGTRVLPKERFSGPIAQGEAGFQSWNPTGKVRRPEPVVIGEENSCILCFLKQ